MINAVEGLSLKIGRGVINANSELMIFQFQEHMQKYFTKMENFTLKIQNLNLEHWSD